MDLDELITLWLNRMNQANGDDYNRLYRDFACWIADLPPSKSKTIREYVAKLRDKIQAEDLEGTEIEPFVDGLVARHDPEAAPLLGELLILDNFFMKEDLAEGLGEMGETAKGAVPYLIQVIRKNGNEEEQWVRAKAAWALGKIGDASAVEALIDALSDPAGPVRLNATSALRALGAKRATRKILRMMEKDKDYLVRAEAARALGNWQIQEALPLLK
ncbi:MAG: HEAT repeat domain-containing protein, partial [bacterium]